MNSEQWSSLIRVLLAIVLGPSSILVLKGILTQDQANQLIPILVPIIMAAGAAVIGIFSARAHSASSVVAAVNSDSVPGVKVVAESSPSQAVQVTSSGDVKPLPAAPGKP